MCSERGAGDPWVAGMPGAVDARAERDLHAGCACAVVVVRRGWLVEERPGEFERDPRALVFSASDLKKNT